MRELSTREIQKRQLEILDHVVSYCEEHGLSYVLMGGALLGAVRNGQLIPWDDDIDLFMTRADYRKFTRKYEDTDRFMLLTSEREKEYYYPFAKVCDKETVFEESAEAQGMKSLSCLHVGIDIFPIDYLPDNPLIKNWKIFQQRLLQGLCYRDFRYLDPHTVSLPVRCALSAFKKLKGLKGDSPDSYIAAMDTLWGDRSSGTYFYDSWTYEPRLAKAIFPTGIVTLEGKQYAAPNDTDHFLTESYGPTYMTPRVDAPDGHGKAYVL